MAIQQIKLKSHFQELPLALASGQREKNKLALDKHLAILSEIIHLR